MRLDKDIVISVISAALRRKWIFHKNNKVCLISFLPSRGFKATVRKQDVVQTYDRQRETR